MLQTCSIASRKIIVILLDSKSLPVFMIDTGFISSSVNSVVGRKKAKAILLVIMSLSFLSMGQRGGVSLSAVRIGIEFLSLCLGSQIGGLIFTNAEPIPNTLQSETL